LLILHLFGRDSSLEKLAAKTLRAVTALDMNIAQLADYYQGASLSRPSG